jgi:hypothetical protein
MTIGLFFYSGFVGAVYTQEGKKFSPSVLLMLPSEIVSQIVWYVRLSDMHQKHDRKKGAYLKNNILTIPAQEKKHTFNFSPYHRMVDTGSTGSLADSKIFTRIQEGVHSFEVQGKNVAWLVQKNIGGIPKKTLYCAHSGKVAIDQIAESEDIALYGLSACPSGLTVQTVETLDDRSNFGDKKDTSGGAASTESYGVRIRQKSKPWWHIKDQIAISVAMTQNLSAIEYFHEFNKCLLVYNTGEIITLDAGKKPTYAESVNEYFKNRRICKKLFADSNH